LQNVGKRLRLLNSAIHYLLIMNPTEPTPKRSRLRKKLELMLEMGLWRFRLIAIVPVVMSLASTLLTFAIGTRDIFKSIKFLFLPLIPRKSPTQLLPAWYPGSTYT